jgi:hypothetical protein
MTLNEWQQRLEGHFADLKRQRNRSGTSGTIYALEHDLAPPEILDLGNGIRRFICNSRPSDRHWLPWVVYSAEIGYEYAGDEYWETFAYRTPGWIESGAQRSWIRSAFLQFHQEYGGAQPVGRWAEHFSIICWPITHAILPRDLQRQLAEVLFDIRDLFTPELLRSPELLGMQIEAHSWDASSRFCDLAEEHLLLGQIATGLLLSDEEMETALVLPSTLRRIAADLGQNRRSRDWLRDAKGRAATVRLRGLQRGGAEETPFVDEDEDETVAESENRRTVVELGVEPDLILRRVGPELWDVRLRLRDLSGLLARFPQFKDVLANERCTVAGVNGPPLARGFLLHGMQEVSLGTWPKASELLLKFEHSTAQLDFLLTAECLLRPGPHWLFKVLADGSAAEIKSRVIQPGNSYIVLTRASSVSGAPQVESTQIATKCAGVSAVRIDVPDVVSEIYSEQILGLGLHAGSGLRLKPIGLPAAKWDDQGYAEWLSGDSPAIAVSSDFEMDGIALNLVGPCPAKLELSGSQLNSPILLELGRLEGGRYKLHVIVSRDSANQKLVHGTLAFTVRDATPWKGPRSGASPFAVLVSPAKPHLEHVWDGSATVEINGPKSRKADCEFRFYRDAALSDLAYAKRLPPIELPCTTCAWEAALSGASEDLKMQNAYDESVACIVEWRCEELGEFVLCCERQPTPLRWILKQENSGYYLRLAQLDDQQPVRISRYAYETPCQSTPIPGTHSEPFRLPPEGGMYVAQTSACLSAIVIPPHIRSFQQLGLRPQLQPLQRNEKDIADLLDLMQLWEGARTTGDPISQNKKRRVLDALENQLMGLLCGDSWARLERDLHNSPDRLFEIRNAITSNLRLAGIGKSLMEKATELRQFSSAEICRYLGDLTRTYLDLPAFTVPGDRVARDQDWIVDFAYQLVSEPGQVREWVKADLSLGLHYLLRNHTLLRMARFAALLRSQSSVDAAISLNAK